MFLNFNNYKLDTGRRLLHDLTYMGHFFFFKVEFMETERRVGPETERPGGIGEVLVRV